MDKKKKRTLTQRVDSLLERWESRILKLFQGDRTTLFRVGHCAFCNVWCRGTLRDGFVHEDGEVYCHNIDTKAIPRQVYLEQKSRATEEFLRRLNNG